MTKRAIRFLILSPLLVAVSLGFTSTKKTNVPQNFEVKEALLTTVPLELEVKTPTNILFTEDSFVGFKEALAFKESGGNYFTVNDFGYLGKYQFGKGTLALIGVYNPNGFLYSPALQEKAIIANLSRNKWVLRKDIKRYVGRNFNGVLVTESGILAAAHLAGPGNVKKYLRSAGKFGFQDAFGTSIKNYMKKFSGYDTSCIVPNKKAKV